MSGANSPQGGLTRRSFLKTTGAVAGAAVLTGTAGTLSAQAENSVDASPEEQVFSGACRGNCCGGCALDLFVRDGKLVRTYFHELPDEEYNHRICLRGLSHIQRIYDDNRLKYPLKRVEGTERGEGQWERITWDEAFDTIVEKWTAYREEFGPESILGKMDGGNFASVHGGTNGSLFMSAMQMSAIDGAVDNILIKATVDAMGASTSYSMNELSDIANAKTIIAWGADVADSYLQGWRFFADAKENGAKLIVIDPLYTTLASKADIYVPIRPASDAALAMAMIKVCMDEDLVDVEFVRNSTVGPLLVKKDDGKFLRGSDLGIEPKSKGVNEKTGIEEFDDPLVVWDEALGEECLLSEAEKPSIEGSFDIDGIKVETAYSLLKDRVWEFTPEKAQEICDVPADTIREITRIYATETPGTIFPGYGIDHYTNGEHSLHSVMALAMVTGNLGKEGASCGLVMPLETLWADPSARALAGTKPWGSILTFELANVLKTGEYMGRKINIKSMFVTHGNWFGNRVNHTETVDDIIANIEFIVCVALNMTDTAQYADIVLPAAHWFEVNDLFGAYSPQPYLMIQEKAIDPYFEARPDFEIQTELLKRMGVAEPYWDMGEEEFMKLLLSGEAAKTRGITLERLRDEKVIRLFPKPCIHAEGGVFPTATGRAQFYLENPKVLHDFGQEWDVDKARMPVMFEEPTEAWSTNPLHEKYPLSLIQQHSKWRTHTQWGFVSWLRELDPEPVAKINPDDAASRGIFDGDYIKVFNDRGHVVLKAVVSNGIRPGCIDIPKGWQRGQFVSGHYQDLTSKETSPVYVNSPFYDVLVNMEKYNLSEGDH